MKASFLLALLLLGLASCNSLPPAVAPALTGATGAYLGHDISDGSPAGAVLGAAAGVAAGSAVNYWNQTGKEKAYGTGYDQGRSDEVKRLYWASKRLHEGDLEAPLKRGYYEIPVPEHVTTDGVVIEAHTQIVEVIEP